MEQPPPAAAAQPGKPGHPPSGEPRGPLRVCCTCLVILGLLAGGVTGSLYVAFQRAYDPARAQAALQEILPLTPPPGYQASFQWDWGGVRAVIMGPVGMDLRSPQGSGLRMLFGARTVPADSDGPRVQQELVQWLQANEFFQLRVEQTREVLVRVRGQELTGTEVLGTALQGGERCRLLTVIVPRDAEPGPLVLVGGLGGREAFDQAAWEALLGSIPALRR